jgi:hypothetical protein
MFTQIHEIVFWGNGGYSWETVYNMPLWLRKFTFKQIKDHQEKLNSQNSLPTDSPKEGILGPDIRQNYTYTSNTS